MADTSFVGESAAMMAELRARLRMEEVARTRAINRSLAGLAVAVLHVVFVFVLIKSQWLPVALPKPQEIKPLMWVVLTQPAKAPNESITHGLSLFFTESTVEECLTGQSESRANPDIARETTASSWRHTRARQPLTSRCPNR